MEAEKTQKVDREVKLAAERIDKRIDGLYALKEDLEDRQIKGVLDELDRNYDLLLRAKDFNMTDTLLDITGLIKDSSATDALLDLISLGGGRVIAEQFQDLVAEKDYTLIAEELIATNQAKWFLKHVDKFPAAIHNVKDIVGEFARFFQPSADKTEFSQYLQYLKKIYDESSYTDLMKDITKDLLKNGHEFFVVTHISHLEVDPVTTVKSIIETSPHPAWIKKHIQDLDSEDREEIIKDIDRREKEEVRERKERLAAGAADRKKAQEQPKYAGEKLLEKPRVFADAIFEPAFRVAVVDGKNLVKRLGKAAELLLHTKTDMEPTDPSQGDAAILNNAFGGRKNYEVIFIDPEYTLGYEKIEDFLLENLKKQNISESIAIVRPEKSAGFNTRLAEIVYSKKGADPSLEEGTKVFIISSILRMSSESNDAFEEMYRKDVLGEK